MKICYIANGGSIHTVRWAKWFLRKGHEIHLITPECEPIEGVIIHHVPIDKGFFIPRPGITSSIKKIIKDIEPDILHAHQVPGYGMYGAFSGFKPFVVTPWGSDITYFTDKFLNKLIVKKVLKKADLINCGDESLSDRVRNLIGPKGSIRTLTWGIDTKNFKPIEREKTDKITIGYLRNLDHMYRSEILIHAIPIVMEVSDNIEFIIIRSGKDMEEIINTIDNLNIGHYIRYVEKVSHENMPELINNSDIYVDTTYSDMKGCGIGITTMEAMSCGLPVVISNTAGADLYVTHKENGYIYEGMNSASLAEALIELISDDALRERIGKNAREYITKDQNWDNNMQIIEDHYRKLAKKGVDNE